MYILYMWWCREYLQGNGYTRKHEILNNAQHNLALYPPARLGALPRLDQQQVIFSCAALQSAS